MRSPLASIHKSPALPYAGGALGIGIFVFDTLSPQEFASESVFFYNGNIDKFLGHGLMAVFGPPLPGPVDATSAARCALHISQSVERWNDRCRRSGEAKIRIAVGIHYGEVVQGDIGSDKLLELTVVGDTVYIASRVEYIVDRLMPRCSSLAHLSIFCARKAAKNSQPNLPTKGITSSPVALSQSTSTT